MDIKTTKHLGLLAAAQEQIDMWNDEPRIHPDERTALILQIADIYACEAAAIETEWYEWPEMAEFERIENAKEDGFLDEEPF